MTTFALLAGEGAGSDAAVGFASAPTLDAADALNLLLKREIAAEEAYGLCAARLATDPEHARYTGLLRQFQEEHELVVQVLRESILDLGGSVTDESGDWGSWAGAIKMSLNTDYSRPMRVTELFHRLRDAELIGRNYAAEMAGLTGGKAGEFIQDQVLPMQSRHAKMLADASFNATAV